MVNRGVRSRHTICAKGNEHLYTFHHFHQSAPISFPSGWDVTLQSFALHRVTFQQRSPFTSLFNCKVQGATRSGQFANAPRSTGLWLSILPNFNITAPVLGCTNSHELRVHHHRLASRSFPTGYCALASESLGVSTCPRSARPVPPCCYLLPHGLRSSCMVASVR